MLWRLTRLGDLADHGGRRHRAGGVVGRDQHQRLGARRDARLDGRRHERKVIFLVGGHRHRHAATHAHRHVVGREARRGDQHLVARIDQAQHEQHDRLLHAGGDDDLVGAVGQPVVAAQRVGNRLAQLRQPGRVGVVMLVLVQRTLWPPRQCAAACESRGRRAPARSRRPAPPRSPTSACETRHPLRQCDPPARRSTNRS